ncbi:retrovirus-related pol polyprotein from transposon 17.6 [Plakobranchus ocellatus]|uniref:Retrovirus-related pol polyprotein from transposon 17.6 n=1 Tax=Plakobranchus ocellatus TaxID=259542 RepID=A0AAV3Y7E8_9GAST|nr:retrovirus-related pol polyprotein from transposon 17.6 [Plakobranchus ocellatus]
MVSPLKVSAGVIYAVLCFAVNAMQFQEDYPSCYDCLMEDKYYAADEIHQIPIGANDCRRYRCSHGNFVYENDGCKLDGKCHDIGFVLNQTANCTMTQCVRSLVNGMWQSRFMEVPAGCQPSDGKCYKYDSNYTENCITYKCTRTVLENGEIQPRFVISSSNASDYGVGAVLLQARDDVLMPCPYASKKLSPAEMNYSTIERQCIAIVYSVNPFYKFLAFRHFELQTDHKPPVFLKKGSVMNSRLMRWALHLQESFVHDHSNSWRSQRPR